MINRYTIDIPCDCFTTDTISTPLPQTAQDAWLALRNGQEPNSSDIVRHLRYRDLALIILRSVDGDLGIHRIDLSDHASVTLDAVLGYSDQLTIAKTLILIRSWSMDQVEKYLSNKVSL